MRIFHGLRRFSQDLVFSLITPDTDFRLEDYFSSLIQEFNAVGKDVVISKKEKTTVISFQNYTLHLKGTILLQLNNYIKKNQIMADYSKEEIAEMISTAQLKIKA